MSWFLLSVTYHQPCPCRSCGSKPFVPSVSSYSLGNRDPRGMVRKIDIDIIHPTHTHNLPGAQSKFALLTFYPSTHSSYKELVNACRSCLRDVEFEASYLPIHDDIIYHWPNTNNSVLLSAAYLEPLFNARNQFNRYICIPMHSANFTVEFKALAEYLYLKVRQSGYRDFSNELLRNLYRLASLSAQRVYTFRLELPTYYHSPACDVTTPEESIFAEPERSSAPEQLLYQRLATGHNPNQSIAVTSNAILTPLLHMFAVAFWSNAPEALSNVLYSMYLLVLYGADPFARGQIDIDDSIMSWNSWFCFSSPFELALALHQYPLAKFFIEHTTHCQTSLISLPNTMQEYWQQKLNRIEAKRQKLAENRATSQPKIYHNQTAICVDVNFPKNGGLKVLYLAPKNLSTAQVTALRGLFIEAFELCPGANQQNLDDKFSSEMEALNAYVILIYSAVSQEMLGFSFYQLLLEPENNKLRVYISLAYIKSKLRGNSIIPLLALSVAFCLQQLYRTLLVEVFYLAANHLSYYIAPPNHFPKYQESATIKDMKLFIARFFENKRKLTCEGTQCFVTGQLNARHIIDLIRDNDFKLFHYYRRVMAADQKSDALNRSVPVAYPLTYETKLHFEHLFERSGINFNQFIRDLMCLFNGSRRYGEFHGLNPFRSQLQTTRCDSNFAYLHTRAFLAPQLQSMQIESAPEPSQHLRMKARL